MSWNKAIVVAVASVAVACVWSLTAIAADADDNYTPTKEVIADWNKNCAQCHGKDGKGNTKMGKKFKVRDYTDPKVVAKFKDAKEQFKLVKEGMEKDGKTLMKPFAKKLKDEEITALIKHTRNLAKLAAK